MLEQDIDAQLAEAIKSKEEASPKLCVWSQGKTFEFPAEANAIVSADHQYLEIRLTQAVTGGKMAGLAPIETIVLGGFVGLWGYKWR